MHTEYAIGITPQVNIGGGRAECTACPDWSYDGDRAHVVGEWHLRSHIAGRVPSDVSERPDAYLARIAEFLSGREWQAEDFETVADTLRDAGFEIAGPGELKCEKCGAELWNGKPCENGCESV